MVTLFKFIFVCLILCGNIFAINVTEDIVAAQTVNSEDNQEKTEQDNERNYVQNARSCMEFRLGCSTDTQPIVIYTVPSCTHCGTFLATIVPKFLEQYGAICGICIKFIVTCPDDIQILKSFYKKFSQAITPQESSKQTMWINMFWNYVDFMKVVIANQLNTKEALLRFGFSQQEIDGANPDPDGNIEKAILAIHSRHSNELTEINESKELDVPYIVYHGKCIKNLELVAVDQKD